VAWALDEHVRSDAASGRAEQSEASRIVYFATGSPSKLRQYGYLLSQHGVIVRSVRPLAHLPEPQVDGLDAHDESILVADPLKTISRFAALADCYPLLVEDTMLFIEHFNEDVPALPGPDTKRWWLALGNRGLLRLMAGSARRAARYVCQLGVTTGPGDYRVFRAELEGRISVRERVTDNALANFPRTNATFFHPIFIPSSAKRSLGEMCAEDFAVYDYRNAVVRKASRFLRSAASAPLQGQLFSPDAL
jgi:inosine/xanthosine triphosphate pyrophosphatase family protein